MHCSKAVCEVDEAMLHYVHFCTTLFQGLLIQIKSYQYAFISTGNGKSMFGYWLLHKWALEGRRIVFQKKYEGQHCILFCREGVFRVIKFGLLTELLDDPETRCCITL